MGTLWERQKEFTGWLRKGFAELGLKGLPRISASAIGGNGSVENDMLPVTVGQKDHGSDGGLQWRLDRLDGPTGLKGWAAQRGLDWATLKTQAAFTLWELKRDYAGGLEKRLREAKEGKDWDETKEIVNRLTEDFCRVYERPNMAVANLPLRKRHARSIQLLLMREEAGPTVGTQAGAVVVAGGGALVAGANSLGAGSDMASLVTLGLALLASWAIWKFGQKDQPALALLDEEGEGTAGGVASAPELLQPMELSVSLTTALDAAVANEAACKLEWERARERTEVERGKVRGKIEEMKRAIEASKESKAKESKAKETNGIEHGAQSPRQEVLLPVKREEKGQ